VFYPPVCGDASVGRKNFDHPPELRLAGMMADPDKKWLRLRD
jgi:hypothetical protein